MTFRDSGSRSSFSAVSELVLIHPPIWALFGTSGLFLKLVLDCIYIVNFGFGSMVCLYVFNSAPLGIFDPFWAQMSYFWGWAQIQKLYLDLLKQTVNFGFGQHSTLHYFRIGAS